MHLYCRMRDVAMMTPEQLGQALPSCLAQPIPLDVRPRLAALLRGSGKVELRYEWVTNWTAFNAIAEKSGWIFSDGAEWVSLSRPADVRTD